MLRHAERAALVYPFPGPRWRWISGPEAAATAAWLRSWVPGLLFGLRLWAAVCLALYVAFWLRLDNASWAGTSAAIVCQPSLGASLRKGSFRLIGTVIGATMTVVIASVFSQDREAFLLSLALWGGVCGFFASTLRNFMSYGAALAGYTALIIASDSFGATGGIHGDIFMLAVTRASEICIGIVCAGIVLAGTDLGGARRRLTLQFANLAADIGARFAGTFAWVGPKQAETRSARRELVGRVVALGPVIDEAIGESSDLRYRLRALQGAVGGLFAALSGWRTVANSLEWLPQEPGRREAEMVLQALPQDLRSPSALQAAPGWTVDPSQRRRAYRAAARALLALPADTPSLRLLADGAARALLGLSRALEGLALLLDQARAGPRGRAYRLGAPDLLPAIVSGVRVFVTISVAALFWIVTAWPSGGVAMTFAAIGALLLSPQEDRAYAGAMAFARGLVILSVLAAFMNFAVLPGAPTFLAFCIAIGCVLVPFGALSTRSWQRPTFAAIASLFIPILAPANQMTYDTIQFYNSTSGILSGMAIATLGILLIPPLTPAFRVRRLLNIARRDLRRLAAGRLSPSISNWENRIYGYLTALPAQVEPLPLAQMVTTLSVGGQIVHLRRAARRFDLGPDLDAALDAIAEGRTATAADHLARVDRDLAANPGMGAAGVARLRARASIRGMLEAFTRHGAYFDTRSPQ